MIAPSKDKKRGDNPRRGMSSGRRILVAAVVLVVVVAVAVALWMSQSAETEVTEEELAEKPRQIVEVAPSAPAPVAEPKAEEKPVDPNARPTKVGEVVNGYVMLPSGRIHKPTGVVTNRVADYGKSKYSIFENRSDNEIAGILMAKPGEAVVGTKRYDKWFEKQFLKSIETPIIVSQDDVPWQADLKRLVVQARLELKAAYDNGEDIAAIMTESRQQLQDLGKYKQAIRQLYAQNMKECDSDVELAELQRAVNMMLEEKGCAPMNFTPLTKLHLMKENTNE